MGTDIVELILLALTASVKFAVFVPLTIVSQKLGFWEALIFAVSSGGFGIVLFVYLSRSIISAWQWIKAKTGLNKNKKPKRKFSRKSRLIVKLKSRYGLWGIAFLSPLLISIPVGCFIASRYYKNRKRVLLVMFAGVVFWSLVFAGFAESIKSVLETLHLA